ncbi:MAG: 50S ribosomal protein L10 [Candidatus Methanomethylicia archaeon]
MSMKGSIPQKKIYIVNELVSLLLKHRTVLFADFSAIASPQLQQLRLKLRNLAILKVAKNRLIKIAFKRIANDEKIINEIEKFLTGNTLLLFTNENPFTIYFILERNKVPRYAKPNDVAIDDIVIPAGNTGLTPGPILSKFGACKIPTKVQEGAVWIIKDTVAVKRGNIISADLADILKKLNIKPIYTGIRIKLAVSNGLIIYPESLKINLDEYRRQIILAFQEALKLCSGIVFITNESAPLIIQKAYLEALNIVHTIPIMIPGIIEEAIKSAYINAYLLSLRVKI